MKRPKISIIGAGFVGSTLAHLLAVYKIGDIVLVDRTEGIAKGKALDISQAGPIHGFDLKIEGTDDYNKTENSDIVVITAGIARKPGMSRDELLKINAEIVKEIAQKSSAYSKNAILIVVTNPLDAMVYLAWKASGFKQSKVIGMAGTLDSSRMRSFIANELGVSVKEISAIVLGGHGDTMVPLMRLANVNGIPVADLLPKEKINAITGRTRDAGAEIVSLLQTGSAYFAPAAAILEMIDSIIFDRKRVFACAAYLSGEYGVSGLFIGVPVVLGINGVEKIIEIDLRPEEKEAFLKTVSHVKSLIASLG